MLRLLTPLVSTIHALAIALIFMSVAEPAAADRVEVSPAQLHLVHWGNHRPFPSGFMTKTT